MSTVLSHVVVPIVMGLIMTFAYLGGFHKPVPHHIPVAVVGTAATAGPTAASIQQAAGDTLTVTTVPTVAEAKNRLTSLDLSGAFVPSATRPTLLAAGAASPSVDQVVRTAFTQVAAKQDKPLTVTDVVPLTSEDPLGQNAFFYLVTLSVASYATAIAIAAAGASRRFRERLGLVVGSAVVIATAELAVASIVYDMFAGHGAAVWAASFFYSLIVVGLAVGLHALVGRFSTLVFSAMFVALNFTSSGGVLSPELQPGFFGWLNAFWIGGGFLDVMRHIVYFPESSLAGGMSVLVGWFVAGCAALVVSYVLERHRERRRREAEHHDTLVGVLRRSGRSGLTEQEATALELEEDVAV